MNYLYLALLLLLTGAQITYAQQKYRSGYTVNLAGDTLHGVIRYWETSQRYTTCCYKLDQKSAITCSAPTELAAYGFADGPHYRTIKLPSAVNPVFVQVLVAGRATLYQHKSRYYAQINSDEFSELVTYDSTIYRQNNPYVAQVKRFAMLLSVRMSDCPDVQSIIQRAKLTGQNLEEIFTKYNECVGQANPSITTKKPWTSFEWGLGINHQISFFRLNSAYFNRIESSLRPFKSTPITPALTLLIKAPRISEKLAVQAGIGFFSEAYSSHVEEIDNIQITTYNAWLWIRAIRATLLGRYTFPVKNWKPYIAIGPGAIIKWQSNSRFTGEVEYDKVINSYREPFFAAKPVTFGLNGAIGLAAPLKKRWGWYGEIRYEYLIGGIAQQGVNPRERTYYQSINLSAGLLFH
ncbi:hypothetical protein [Larkinella rosea]|uniref:PorT family protein n=1 Tax=Larkinella rosea TaxID=2025312 RepID=A0A3P1BB68_9BACT|nr:hypothetical protein [Larkinella rosea]RRA98052.1 hypothetical protein EHT25_30755 [Larkinella rosea]